MALFKILNAKHIAEKETLDKVHSDELQQLAEKIDYLDAQNSELNGMLEDAYQDLSKANSELDANKYLKSAFEKLQAQHTLLKESYESLKKSQESALAAKDQVISTLQAFIDNFKKNK